MKWDSEKLRKLVKQSGMNRFEIADRIGISKGHLDNIMRSRNPETPSVPVLKLISIILGCKPSDLTENLESIRCKPKTILRRSAKNVSQT